MAREPKKIGRPSDFSQTIADTLCERIAESDYGLEQICEAGDMPSARTVFRWLADDRYDAFRQQYARAKIEQGHTQAERGLKEALSATDAALGRLKWDARRWAASKLAPKQYGDKIAHVGGGEGDAPIQTEQTVKLDVGALSDDQLRALASIKVHAG